MSDKHEARSKTTLYLPTELAPCPYSDHEPAYSISKLLTIHFLTHAVTVSAPIIDFPPHSGSTHTAAYLLHAAVEVHARGWRAVVANGRGTVNGDTVECGNGKGILHEFFVLLFFGTYEDDTG